MLRHQHWTLPEQEAFLWAGLAVAATPRGQMVKSANNPRSRPVRMPLKRGRLLARMLEPSEAWSRPFSLSTLFQLAHAMKMVEFH